MKKRARIRKDMQPQFTKKKQRQNPLGKKKDPKTPGLFNHRGGGERSKLKHSKNPMSHATNHNGQRKCARPKTTINHSHRKKETQSPPKGKAIPKKPRASKHNPRGFAARKNCGGVRGKKGMLGEGGGGYRNHPHPPGAKGRENWAAHLRRNAHNQARVRRRSGNRWGKKNQLVRRKGQWKKKKKQPSEGQLIPQLL